MKTNEALSPTSIIFPNELINFVQGIDAG